MGKLLLSIEILGGTFIVLVILLQMLPTLPHRPPTTRASQPHPSKTATTEIWNKGYHQKVRLMVYPNDSFCIAYPQDQAMFCGYFDGKRMDSER